MFRIRRVYDDLLPVNIAALAQVRETLVQQFDQLTAAEADKFIHHLRNPFELRLRPLLFVAENSRRKVLGFALLLHEPVLHCCFLDFISAAPGLTSRGIGGSLYERVRDEAHGLQCQALFLECAPDELPQDAPAPLRRANIARLRFYEAYGARPLVGNAYQTPVSEQDTNPQPYLVADPLGGPDELKASWVRKVVRAYLEGKYAQLCGPEYVDLVVSSFRDPTVRLREPRYTEARPEPPTMPSLEPVPMVVNDRHQIHHVRERGYVESPVRIPRILEALDPTGWFQQSPPKDFSVDHIEAVHDPHLVRYLRRASEEVGEGESLYPYVFPIRNKTRRPRERSVLAGYFCIDTFTPIHRNSFRAAKRAVDCTLTCAERIVGGARFAYSLVRPPGHHAESSSFGGFCYFNNAAVAAHYLSKLGKVAILDLDYHHGNGQQDIFYQRADVLTVSIHGDPSFAYPYYAGFKEERGEGPGEGFNLNLPQPEKLDGSGYRTALRKALAAVNDYAPVFVVIAFGLDPAKGDPTGTWALLPEDFRRNGELVRGLDRPTLVVQEGGYRTRTLGRNARSFFDGLLGAVARTK